MDISLAIVNYNSYKMLFECIHSIYRFADKCTFEIIIVDNASSDNSVELLEQQFPQAQLIVNKDNLGFAKAVNQAFKVSSGEYFFLLNPDTRLISNIFPGMIEFFHRHPKTGILAPRIIFPDGSLHASTRRFITFLGAIMDVFQIHFYFPNNIIANKFNYNHWKHDKTRVVEWVTGAALMTKSEIFETCGMLDERFFMYFEDMDYCESIKKNGLKTYFCPDFALIHHHAKGGSDRLPVRSVDYYISLYHYLFKHFGSLKSGLFRIAMISWGLIYMAVRTFLYFISYTSLSLRERIDIPLRLIFFKSYET